MLCKERYIRIRLFITVACAPIGVIKWLNLIPHKRGKQGGIAVVAIMKNEGPYLEEWISFHKRQGVNKFILFDNDSTDGTREILESYITSGTVIYESINGQARQMDAYNIALKKYGKYFRYFAVIDCDEFLFSTDSMPLIDLLDKFFSSKKGIGGLAVNWMCYGSGGHIEKPDGGVLENFLYRAETNFEKNRLTKTICAPEAVLAFVNAHYAVYRRGYKAYNELGEEVEGPLTASPSHRHIRINHYFTKSRNEYIEKMERGKADGYDKRQMDDFYARDCNDEFDDSILKH